MECSEEENHKFIVQNVRKLVCTFLSPQTGSREQRKCEHLALNELRPKYGTVMGSDVRRTFDELIDRFSFENMNEFAMTLRKVCTWFDAINIWENTDEKYLNLSLFKLLISLTNHPFDNIRNNRKELEQLRLELVKLLDTVIVFESEEPSTNLDELVVSLRDNFIPECSYSDNDSLSDWSDDESNDINDSPVNTGTLLETSQQLTGYRCSLQPLEPPQTTCSHHIHQFDTTDVDEFSERIFTIWRNLKVQDEVEVEVEGSGSGSGDDHELKSSSSSGFHIDYNEYLRKCSYDLLKFDDPTIATEYFLIREIIFMFTKPVNCCFFAINANIISVRGDITIEKMTTTMLQEYLQSELVPALQAMMDLRTLISTYRLTTNTMECFTSALDEFLEPIMLKCLRYEQEPCTLMNFMILMRKDFEKLCFASNICKLCVLKDENQTELLPHIKVGYLLSQLYAQLNSTTQHTHLVSALILKTLKSYCHILDSWWTWGSLQDMHKEFVAENCETGVQLRSIGGDDDDDDDDGLETQNCYAELFNSCELRQYICKYSMETAETHRLLIKLNRLDDMMAEFGKEWHDMHSQLIEELLLIAPPSNETNIKPYSTNKTIWHKDLISLLSHRSVIDAKKNPIVEDNPQSDIHRILQHLERFTYSPSTFQYLLLTKLKHLLNKRSRFTNKFTLRMYKKDVNVYAHMRLLRHLLLHEAEYLLYPFYTSLYEKIEAGQDWAHSLWLRTQLLCTIPPEHAAFAGQLHVNVLPTIRAQSHKVYEALDAVELRYDISAMLEHIISSNSMELYNKIWRYTLKIKWAVWKLNTMQFIPRNKRNPYEPLNLFWLTVRRLEIIRAWLSYVANSLHSYLCTQVLPTFEREFNRQLASCESVQQLSILHESYIIMLAQHGLQTDDFVKLRMGIEQIFHLIYVLDLEWNLCHTFIRRQYDSFGIITSDILEEDFEELAVHRISKLETTYIYYHQMLVRILQDLVTNQKYVNLSSLWTEFSTSIPY